MALTCAITGCSNGSYWLNKWKTQLCEICGCQHKDLLCKCDPPFRLFTFPTKLKDPMVREKWKQLVGRSNGNKLWSPPKDSRVCSRHFPQGKPTIECPLPTINLGYDKAEQRVKRMARFEATGLSKTVKKCKKLVMTELENTSSPTIPDEPDIIIEDPEMELLPPHKASFPWIITVLTFIMGLLKTVTKQKSEIDKLRAKVTALEKRIYNLKNTVYTENYLQKDEDVNFYTGLSSISIFNKFHLFISPYVKRRWTGVDSVYKNVRKFNGAFRFGPSRKLSSKTEFFLMLMKLKLGLLNRDLARRFDISEALCSRIFFTWLRAASAVLKSLVYMSDEESLIATKPDRFKRVTNIHSIIDCTEIFIETPKQLYLQSASWSDYKHHNTLKLLVACTPNSFINYVSPAYLGRISDKALTLDCGYLDMVPAQSAIMADKGFNISDACSDRNISLYVPPGKRGQSQMTSDNVKKTKRIANLRILIEQVIRRLKTFRILSTELPISLIGHIDDIVCVCAALSNLKQPIYKQ